MERLLTGILESACHFYQTLIKEELVVRELGVTDESLKQALSLFLVAIMVYVPSRIAFSMLWLVYGSGDAPVV